MRITKAEGGVRMNDYMMKIAVCDDVPEDLQMIADMAGSVAAQEKIPCELACYESSAALLEAVEAGRAFHVLLLDVMMPEMDGMQLASALRARQNNTGIVFISSNREMALNGYEVAACRYLAKPLETEKLREALQFCYRAGQSRQELMLPTARGTRKFSLDEIVYIETWGRGVRIVLQEGQEEVGLKISEMESMLPAAQFVLCHRTVLVNLAYVRYLRYCELELKTGGVLPVSKYRQNATRDKLMNYLEG